MRGCILHSEDSRVKRRGMESNTGERLHDDIGTAVARSGRHARTARGPTTRAERGHGPRPDGALLPGCRPLPGYRTRPGCRCRPGRRPFAGRRSLPGYRLLSGRRTVPGRRIVPDRRPLAGRRSLASCRCLPGGRPHPGCRALPGGRTGWGGRSGGAAEASAAARRAAARRNRFVVVRDATERDLWAARRRARVNLPSPVAVTRDIALALLEVEAGCRSAVQLERIFSPQLWEALEHRIGRRGGPLPSGRSLISVRCQEDRPGLADTVAVVRKGELVRPVALRLDACGGRWTVTELRWWRNETDTATTSGRDRGSSR
jgi:hypothetical protein